MDDSEDNMALKPPTPPPRKFISRSGTETFRFLCLTKQDSHEQPILDDSLQDGLRQPVQQQKTEQPLIASSLKFAQFPAMVVAGLTPMTPEKPRGYLGDSLHPRSLSSESPNYVPTHRASFHGNRYEEKRADSYQSPTEHYGQVVGSAENLVGRVLQEQGLGKYCDPDFVRTTQRELAEAINLTPEQLDHAAHQLMQAERRQSTPQLYRPDEDLVENRNLSRARTFEYANEDQFLNIGYIPTDETAQNYRDNKDKNQFGDTKL